MHPSRAGEIWPSGQASDRFTLKHCRPGLRNQDYPSRRTGCTGRVGRARNRGTLTEAEKRVDVRPPICDYEGSDYQQRFWDRGERAYEDGAEALAVRRLLSGSGARLLEVGAGAGRHSSRYRGYQEVVLLDASRSQLRQARQRLGDRSGYRFVVGDVYRLPFVAACFDAATMIRTLHHMVEPHAALTQVRKTLAPGALFLLEFANKRNLKAVGRWLLGRQSWNPFSREPVEFVALNYNFHPAAVRAWLHSAGFRLSRQLAVSHFRWGWLKRTVPTRLLLTAERMLQWTGSWMAWTPSVFVAAVAADIGAAQPQGPGRA